MYVYEGLQIIYINNTWLASALTAGIYWDGAGVGVPGDVNQ